MDENIYCANTVTKDVNEVGDKILNILQINHKLKALVEKRQANNHLQRVHITYKSLYFSAGLFCLTVQIFSCDCLILKTHQVPK